MDTNTTLGTSTTFQRTVVTHSGEFTDPQSFMFEPMTEPHTLGYWNLEVTAITTNKAGAEETTMHQRVKLVSLRTEGQHRSSFGEDYHSSIKHHRLSIDLVPKVLLEAISAATGVVIKADS